MLDGIIMSSICNIVPLHWVDKTSLTKSTTTKKCICFIKVEFMTHLLYWFELGCTGVSKCSLSVNVILYTELDCPSKLNNEQLWKYHQCSLEGDIVP